MFFAEHQSRRASRVFPIATAARIVAPSAAIALDAGSSADGAPRTIAFTRANSVDPDAGDSLVYDWDLDGDGAFGDASGVTAFRFYANEGSYRVAVRVDRCARARATCKACS